MSDSNPNSPISSPVSESVRPRVPRTLIAFLAFYFFCTIVSNLFEGNVPALVLTGIIAIATWRTFQGSRSASRYLGGLFSLATLICMRSAYLNWSPSRETAVIALLTAVYMAVIVGYLFLSPSMRALYIQGDKEKWAGR
ncbi:hypothetical protein [Undibacterium crateris]|uniref:hypothetical protein n=1 Tax=Undibacterium crateris TaxID=2528175 RepID=UPI00138968B5|nr:hypothetical protein [Undibacterium crateris]NDI84381.1 hypothetical protein [Undibacterium crateris]